MIMIKLIGVYNNIEAFNLIWEENRMGISLTWIIIAFALYLVMMIVIGFMYSKSSANTE